MTKNGAKVLVAFQFRHHPGLLQAKKLIVDGEIGRVVSAHVHFGEYLPAWHPWEDYRQGYAARADLGGGVVLTQCHSLDYLPWLVGEVKSVWGMMDKISDLEVDVDDTAKIGLRFVSGAMGSLHLDYNQQPPSHHLEVIGTKGSLQMDFADGAVRIYRAEKKEWESYPLTGGVGTERHVYGGDATLHIRGTRRSRSGLSITGWYSRVEVDRSDSHIESRGKTGSTRLV